MEILESVDLNSQTRTHCRVPPRLSVFTQLIRSILLFAVTSNATALDYPHVTAEPQKTGWPLSAEQRAYVADKPEHIKKTNAALDPLKLDSNCQ